MEKVRILAFDPGTAHTGYGTIDGNLRTSEVIALSHFGVLKTKIEDGDIRTRIDILGSLMKQRIELLKPTHVVIEDFTEQGVNTGSIFKEMAFLIEHMRMVGREMGHEVTIFENPQWKRIATGSKGLNKTQVKHFVSHKVPFAKELLAGRTATHVWDSYGIGYAKFIQLQGESQWSR